MRQQQTLATIMKRRRSLTFSHTKVARFRKPFTVGCKKEDCSSLFVCLQFNRFQLDFWLGLVWLPGRNSVSSLHCHKKSLGSNLNLEKKQLPLQLLLLFPLSSFLSACQIGLQTPITFFFHSTFAKQTRPNTRERNSLDELFFRPKNSPKKRKGPLRHHKEHNGSSGIKRHRLSLSLVLFGLLSQEQLAACPPVALIWRAKLASSCFRRAKEARNLMEHHIRE